jgi:hypothetical protein
MRPCFASFVVGINAPQRTRARRWLSPDPPGLGAADPTNPQSWNRYAYALNNPLRYTDPSGLYCFYGGDGDTPQNDGDSSDFNFDEHGDQGRADCAQEGGQWFEDDTQVTVNGNSDGSQTGDFWENGAYLGTETIAANNSTNQKICNSIPNGRVIGVSGGAGALGATVAGGEIVLNYDTGQISAFGFGGFQGGWNGVLSATAYTGLAWGLNGNNSNYSGGFSGFSFGTNRASLATALVVG